MSIDLDQLKQAALAATPGEWWDDKGDDSQLIRVYRGYGFNRRMIADGMGKNDAAFIAAISPAVMRELVARLERAEAAATDLSKDAQRYEYLLSCECIENYLPDLNDLDFKAKLRAKHDAAIAAMQEASK
jgi:hypothetical protein